MEKDTTEEAAKRVADAQKALEQAEEEHARMQEEKRKADAAELEKLKEQRKEIDKQIHDHKRAA